MSIPKEPRQLMINLMYLVLTALLALNVSAEIFNAFKLVDNGLQKSNATLEATSSQIPGRIAELAKKDPLKYEKYIAKANEARKISKEFVEYVEEIKNYMIAETGGIDTVKGQPKGYKDKDITTRYLVGKEPAKNAGKGGELEAKIKETYDKFLALVDDEDKAKEASSITVRIDSAYTTSKTKKNWAHYNFFQMPLLATMPILTKIENDARSSEAAILNYLAGKVGGEDIVFDKFVVVSSTKKSYVIAGETFEAEIFLSAASKNTDGMSISINGSPAAVKDGVAKYSVKTSDTGVKKYTAKATLKNPVTGEVQTYDGSFEYEVGRRSASIQLDKMNVFYLGVDNPISVSAAGVSSNALRVTGSGAGIRLTPNGANKYIVNVSQPGEATITLSAEGLTSSTFNYRVKRIPDPVAKIGRLAGGSMSAGEFKVQPGIIPTLEGFEFEAKCTIESYRIIRIRRGEDPRVANNSGGGFNGEAARLIQDAGPGDNYIITDVKGKCPGDAASRPLNSLAFQIR